MGDEVRLGRGFMFWGITLRLTEEGQRERNIEGIVKAVYDAIAVSPRRMGGKGWLELPVQFEESFWD